MHYELSTRNVKGDQEEIEVSADARARVSSPFIAVHAARDAPATIHPALDCGSILKIGDADDGADTEVALSNTCRLTSSPIPAPLSKARGRADAFAVSPCPTTSGLTFPK